MTRGVVIAPRLGGALVRLTSGVVVEAANALNLRCPPGARVSLAGTPDGYRIVGRDR